jgi:hypothetical protein
VSISIRYPKIDFVTVVAGPFQEEFTELYVDGHRVERPEPLDPPSAGEVLAALGIRYSNYKVDEDWLEGRVTEDSDGWPDDFDAFHECGSGLTLE